MFVVTAVCIVAVLLVQLEAKRKISFGFGLAFFLVTFLQAVHYDYGNDYMTYLRDFSFYTYKPFSFRNLYEYVEFRDPLWPIFCYMFKPFGFFGMVAFLAIFQSSVYFYFIKKYVPEEWIALGVFVYLFTPEIYLLNMSMLRQGFAEAVFLLAFIITQQKTVFRYVISIIIMLCAGQIHSSANLFIPFLLWSLLPMKNAKWVSIALFISFIIVMISRSMVENMIMSFLQIQAFQRFEIYRNVIGGGVGFGFAIMSIPAIMILIFLWFSRDEKINRIVSIAFFERMMVLFSVVSMFVGRLAIFFSIFYMVAIPVAYSKIKDYYYKVTLTTIYVGLALFSYWSFLNNKVYFQKYLTFHSIFEVLIE